MKIKLDIFEGPLDLLLYLIKKNHLSIYDIPVAVVCEQYLQYLEFMKIMDINIASEYMVMAATLINVKSKTLIPKEEIIKEEEQSDPREELVKRLIEYKKFKEAANYLKEKERERLKYIARPSANAGTEEEVYFEASIFDLITALKTALKDVPKDVFFEIVKDEFTVEEKIHDILHMLLVKEKIPISDLFTAAHSKLEVVAIFLAILELIKLGEIIAVQKELFSPIIVARRDRVENAV